MIRALLLYLSAGIHRTERCGKIGRRALYGLRERNYLEDSPEGEADMPSSEMHTVVQSYVRDGLSKKDAIRAAQEWKIRMERMRAEREANNSKKGDAG